MDLSVIMVAYPTASCGYARAIVFQWVAFSLFYYRPPGESILFWLRVRGPILAHPLLTDWVPIRRQQENPSVCPRRSYEERQNSDRRDRSIPACRPGGPRPGQA